MDYYYCYPVKQMRPSTLLCSALVLLLFILPDTNLVDAGGGKKRIVPVKQIFGVGIGYQKVTHYKPVIVFSRHRRPKQKRRRRPGWGWKKGWKSYAPVHVQEHVHKPGRSGSHNRHEGYRSKKPPRHPPPPPSGWGWKPRARKPPRDNHHLRGHGGGGEHKGGYDYHNEGSSHPIIGGGDDYVDEWEGPNSYRAFNNPSNYYYGSPFAGGSVGGTGNYEDHGGFGSEIKNHILNPLTFPSSNTPGATTNPPPPIYPFTEHPKSDASVTSIHRDFLRTHLKNFQQFQEYQRSTSPNEEDVHHNEASHSKNHPAILNPPGPNYSTMDLMNSDSVKVEDADVQYPQYDDPPEDYQYSSETWPGFRGGAGGRSKNDDHTEEIDSPRGWNEDVGRKSMSSFVLSTTTPSPLLPPPPVVVGVTAPNLIGSSSSNSNQKFKANHGIVMMSTTPMPRTKFKASPRIDEMGSGNKFNTPGFFPTFDQFQKIKMK